MEVRDEVLSSVDAQDMDTSGYQMCELSDFGFYWKSHQLDVAAVFGPGGDIPFSPTAFDDLDMGGSAENSKLLHHEKDTANSPPTAAVNLRKTHTTPSIAEISSIRSENGNKF